MKIFALVLVSLALLGALIEALPQRAHFQKLPYYPPPTRPPRPILVRRDVSGVQDSLNSAGQIVAADNFTF